MKKHIPTVLAIVAVIWFVRAPETAAALVNGAFGFLSDGADALAVFSSSVGT